MSDLLYTYGRGQLQAAALSWPSNDWSVYLVDAFAYTVDAEHDYLVSIPENARIAHGILSGKQVIGDGHTAANTAMTGIVQTMGHALVIYQETSNPATSALLCYLDTVLGLPCAPAGTPLTVVWPHGPERIFTLAGAFGGWEGVRQHIPTGGDPCAAPLGISRSYAA